MLKSFATMIGQAIFAALLAYLRDPANRDEIETASKFVVDKATDATPWSWDDKIADLIVGKLSPQIPSVDSVVQQVIAVLPKFPNVFGRGL